MKATLILQREIEKDGCKYKDLNKKIKKSETFPFLYE